MLFGGFTVQFPAFQDPLKFIGLPTATAIPIFPLMFITIACGACSGFHGIVSSGTSSKQLHRETDAPAVGYGGMLLEGVVALIAMATVMMLVSGDPILNMAPDEIYARGIAKFMMIFGIPFGFAVTFGKLAFTTFIYDTLDVATRLGRYILQELTGLQGRTGAYIATFATVAVPALLLMWEVRGAEGQVIPLWKVFWPIFGSSNQLLAALSLLGITVWLKRSGKNPWLTGLPATFMIVITVWSLILITMPWFGGIFRGQIFIDPIGITGTVLLAVALVIILEGVTTLVKAQENIN